MRCQTILLTTLLLIGLPQLAGAQFGRWGDEGDDDLEAWIESGRMRPYLEVNYGVTTPRFSGLDGDFATLGNAELKLGFAAVDSQRAALVSLDERYVYGGFMSEDIRPFGSTAADEDLAKLSRFGFGNRLGYGFGGKALTLEMYNQNALGWTSLRAADFDNASAEAQAIFDRYGTQFRFGQLMEAGVKLHLARSIAISVGVEGAVVFPRHVFWPWLGSSMIYSGAQGALEYFAEHVVELSPVIGPLLHFLLKSGVSLGYYLLLQDDMNWPFDQETPLTLESAKLGVALTF